MINRLVYKTLDTNDCAMECNQQTTVEGLMCRRHWDMAQGILKERYQAARTQIIKDVWAKENLKR